MYDQDRVGIVATFAQQENFDKQINLRKKATQYTIEKRDNTQVAILSNDEIQDLKERNEIAWNIVLPAIENATQNAVKIINPTIVNATQAQLQRLRSETERALILDNGEPTAFQKPPQSINWTETNIAAEIALELNRFRTEEINKNHQNGVHDIELNKIRSKPILDANGFPVPRNAMEAVLIDTLLENATRESLRQRYRMGINVPVVQHTPNNSVLLALIDSTEGRRCGMAVPTLQLSQVEYKEENYNEITFTPLRKRENDMRGFQRIWTDSTGMSEEIKTLTRGRINPLEQGICFKVFQDNSYGISDKGRGKVKGTVEDVQVGNMLCIGEMENVRVTPQSIPFDEDMKKIVDTGMINKIKGFSQQAPNGAVTLRCAITHCDADGKPLNVGHAVAFSVQLKNGSIDKIQVHNSHRATSSKDDIMAYGTPILYMLDKNDMLSPELRNQFRLITNPQISSSEVNLKWSQKAALIDFKELYNAEKMGLITAPAKRIVGLQEIKNDMGCVSYSAKIQIAQSQLIANNDGKLPETQNGEYSRKDIDKLRRQFNQFDPLERGIGGQLLENELMHQAMKEMSSGSVADRVLSENLVSATLDGKIQTYVGIKDQELRQQREREILAKMELGLMNHLNEKFPKLLPLKHGDLKISFEIKKTKGVNRTAELRTKVAIKGDDGQREKEVRKAFHAALSNIQDIKLITNRVPSISAVCSSVLNQIEKEKEEKRREERRTPELLKTQEQKIQEIKARVNQMSPEEKRILIATLAESLKNREQSQTKEIVISKEQQYRKEMSYSVTAPKIKSHTIEEKEKDTGKTSISIQDLINPDEVKTVLYMPHQTQSFRTPKGEEIKYGAQGKITMSNDRLGGDEVSEQERKDLMIQKVQSGQLVLSSSATQSQKKEELNKIATGISKVFSNAPSTVNSSLQPDAKNTNLAKTSLSI